MAATDPENRFFAHQIVHGLVRVGKRRRIARTVGEKNSVWIQCQRFVGTCRCGNNSYSKAFLAQKPENVFLDTIVIRSNSKSDRRKRRFAAFILLNRPWRAELV